MSSLDIQDCECYSRGLNYIIWNHSENPKGIWIIHIGGPSKRELFRMMQQLMKTEFLNMDLYFHTQDDTYWRNHSVLDGYLNNLPVYKYINKEI